MKRIVYLRPDGDLSVVIPVISPGFTEQDAVDRALTKDVPPGATSIRVVDAAELPTNRVFRNGWKVDLTIDMLKAREIHRDRIRAAREKEFKTLDAEWMKAVGQKKTAEADVIEAKRQALRDAPDDPRINAAVTPEELNAIWPAGLPR